MDAERWQRELAALADLSHLQIGRHVHRGGDGEDALGFNLLQRFVE
jgi:hypothetical protein